MAMSAMLLLLSACDGQKWSEEQVGSFILVTQRGGATLGYSPQSGVKLLTHDGYAFKDLNRNDSLDAYEDWRCSAQERAANLASMLSIEVQQPSVCVDDLEYGFRRFHVQWQVV